MGRMWLALVAVVVLVRTVAAVPFWGAKDSLPPGTPPSAIKPETTVPLEVVNADPPLPKG